MVIFLKEKLIFPSEQAINECLKLGSSLKKFYQSMTKKILLTRPVEDSLITKEKLEKIGFQTVIIPLIKICKLNHAEIPLKEYDLIILQAETLQKYSIIN